MGTIQHHAIVVTCWNDSIHGHRAVAAAIFGEGQVSAVTEVTTNSYSSFFVAPDGSKDGWEESNEGDARRAKFVAYLKSTQGSPYWVEVGYGELGHEAEAYDGYDFEVDEDDGIPF